jgi:hypothetical protein
LDGELFHKGLVAAHHMIASPFPLLSPMFIYPPQRLALMQWAQVILYYGEKLQAGGRAFMRGGGLFDHPLALVQKEVGASAV